MTNVENCAYGGRCLPHTGLNLTHALIWIGVMLLVGVVMFVLSRRGVA